MLLLFVVVVVVVVVGVVVVVIVVVVVVVVVGVVVVVVVVVVSSYFAHGLCPVMVRTTFEGAGEWLRPRLVAWWAEPHGHLSHPCILTDGCGLRDRVCRWGGASLDAHHTVLWVTWCVVVAGVAWCSDHLATSISIVYTYMLDLFLVLSQLSSLD